MDPVLERLTAKYAVATAVAAFVTHPVPVVDELFVLPIQASFVRAFVRRRGGSLLHAPWSGVGAIALGGLGARLLSRLTLGFVPPWGGVGSAILSAATTVLLGRYLDRRIPAPPAPGAPRPPA